MSDSGVRCQAGQSIVEFLAAASFALVPMLFLVTYLGKTGDMQYRALEAARYSVWEAARTSKQTVQIQNEIARRVYYKDYRTLDSISDGKLARVDVSRIEPLYFHVDDTGRYRPLLVQHDSQIEQTAIDNQAPETNLYQARLTVARAIPARIDVNDKGMITGTVTYAVDKFRWLPDTVLSAAAHNTILTEMWRAPTHGSVERTIDRAILARSRFIDNGLLGLAKKLADLVGLREWSELDPGHIEHDVVPCSRLTGGGDSEDACR